MWAAQQPLDKRLFESDYDDVELLGKLVTRGDGWQAAGLLAGLAEHALLWPLSRVLDRAHPARRELVPLSGNRRAFAQAAWRHALFGLVLGALEALINDRSADEPPPIPFSSNGHGSLEAAVSVAEV